MHLLTGHQQPVSAIAFSPDGQQLVSSSLDKTIKLWDLEAAECLATWKSRCPCEGMQIDRIQGLTKAQQATLQALGATDGRFYP